ncbi:hypothetical protein ASG00_12500 [Microbacterium sp. Leaf351]|nr:hypothetical protein ASG00_12500 [Microbacterium sp. Leaf351]
MSTLAPKCTARAIATAWRSPPESVPIGWSVSRRSIPICLRADFVTSLAFFTERSPRAFGPLTGSLPRKKLRQIDIRGTVARSWNTVAIPRPSASRGDENSTGSPSSVTEPELGLWTPDRILISVDLPAPLSPRTHVTVPGSTRRLMSRSAITLPKVLPTFFSSRAA